MKLLNQHLIQILAIFLIVSLLGTTGYLLIEEGWSIFDAFYMTVITLTTVGFGEVRPLSTNGRIFTVILMLVGIGGVAYAFSLIAEYLVSTSLTGLARERRMMREINSLENHYIVCGYGRVGESAVETILDSKGRSAVVIIDSLQERIDRLREEGRLTIQGDATNDDILRQAGIERAKGLLVCTGNDIDNLFIVLSARSLNAALFIVARSSNAANGAKMMRAGADKIISPYRIGGQRMANMLIKPNVSDFMDVVTVDAKLELWLEELTIRPQSPLAGQTVIETNLRQKLGVTMVALRRGGNQIISPDGNTRLHADDHLIVLGTREQLEAMEKLVSGEKDFTHPKK